MTVIFRIAATIFTAGVALLQPSVANAETSFDPYAGPRPIAVFIEQNPWLMVVGSDTPRVAVYENGDVIYLKKAGDTYVYRSGKLAPNQLASFQAKWSALIAAKPKRQYELSEAISDLTTAQFYLRDGDQTLTVSAYGLDCDGTQVPPSAFTEEPPTELFQVHRELCDFDLQQSQPWIARYVEVMLWDYGYAPQPSIHWPRNWPDLNSDRAFQRGESWSIFLDGRSLSQLESFLATRREKGAVEVGGKKWAASYRFAMPSEPVWREAMMWREDKE